MRSDIVFWGHWVFANLVGELLGLGLVGVVGYATYYAFGEPGSAGWVLASAAFFIGLGALEGAIVGIAQASVLRRRLPRLRTWVAATMVAAVIAWTVGMLADTGMKLVGFAPATTTAEISDTVQLLLAVPLGVVTGAILGLPQWLVLKRYVSRAGWWISANALAWACGMPFIFFVAAAAPSDNVLSALVTFIASIAAAGALVGAIHGAFLVVLLAPSNITRTGAHRGAAADGHLQE